MLRTIKLCLAVLPVMLAAGAASAAPSPLGTWIDHTGRGAVEITDCNGALCGRIVWLKAAGDAEACNMQIIGNVKPVSGAKWDGGWIYDPERKAKYDVEVSTLGDQKLKVFGYSGFKLFGESMVWTRAPANLERCSTVAAAKTEDPKPEAAKADPKPSVSAPAPEATPPPRAEKEAKTERPQKKARQARAKDNECAFNVPELGKITVPC